jgi:hypothetical protein
MGWYQLTLAGYASSRSSVACSVLPSAPDHELQDSFAPHARGFTGGRETATCRNWVHESMKPSQRQIACSINYPLQARAIARTGPLTRSRDRADGHVHDEHASLQPHLRRQPSARPGFRR